MAKKPTDRRTKTEIMRMKKMVKVTIELPESFVRLLNAKAVLSGWNRWSPTGPRGKKPQMDAGSVLAWLILLEARGTTIFDIEDSTPPMWKDEDGPQLDYSERKVYEIQKDGTPRYITGGAR